MCIKVIERYAVCRCIYYSHAVDLCPTQGAANHQVQVAEVLVGYTCSRHNASSLETRAETTKIRNTRGISNTISISFDLGDVSVDGRWQCEAKHPKTGERCVLIKTTHTKDHQTANGKVFADKTRSYDIRSMLEPVRESPPSAEQLAQDTGHGESSIPLRDLGEPQREATPIVEHQHFKGVRPCYILLFLGTLTILGSLVSALWRSVEFGDLSGGFTLAQYVLGVGVFVTGSMTAIHSKTCTCWRRWGISSERTVGLGNTDRP